MDYGKGYASAFLVPGSLGALIVGTLYTTDAWFGVPHMAWNPWLALLAGFVALGIVGFIVQAVVVAMLKGRAGGGEQGPAAPGR